MIYDYAFYCTPNRHFYPYIFLISPNFKFPVENIEVGKLSLLSLAAKNYSRVAVATDQHDYGMICSDLHLNNGAVAQDSRKKLAKKVWEMIARYACNDMAGFLK